MPVDKDPVTQLPAKGPEFDAFARAYPDLLRDPLRARFGGQQAEVFHQRKCDFLVRRFARKGLDTRSWSYLDIGCGRGELMRLLGTEFSDVTGSDTSASMLREAEAASPAHHRLVHQADSQSLPFADESFDFVTAVCIYHHAPAADQVALTREIRRVLKVGGVFCLMEHNPLNPSPVDADARLLSHQQAQGVMREGGLSLEETSFFLYLPAVVYRWLPALEDRLRNCPLGGQYAVFGRR